MTFKEFRSRAGFTQKLLSDLSGYSIQQIRKVEQNPHFIDNCSFAFVHDMWFQLIVNTDFDYIELSEFAHQIYMNVKEL